MLVAIALALVIGAMAVAWAQGTTSQSGSQGATCAAGSGGGLMAKLTADQQAQIKAKIADLKQQGATRPQIWQAVKDMLTGWGIALPQGMAGRGQGFMEKLTADQRGQLSAKIEEMRQQGATPEQIHQAIADMLKGWGIELPARGAGMGARLMAKLTPDQQQQLKTKLADLKQQGATREQIRQAVVDMLNGWGIAPPQRPAGAGWGVTAKLTADQRAQVKAKIADLRQQGATREQIHQAIADMLKSWGIEVPQPGAAASGS